MNIRRHKSSNIRPKLAFFDTKLYCIVRKLTYLVLFNILLVLPQLNGQDIHFSQYYNAQMNLNPALVGLIDGEMRYAGAYRSQWTSVPVSYQVISGAFDMKFGNGYDPNGFFGGGVHLYHDQAGDSRLSSTRVSLVGSYTRRLFQNQYLTFGAMAGVTQRAFLMDDLRFDGKWDGVKYNSALGNNENFSSTNKFFANLSAGLNYNMSKSARTKLNFGAAYFNINKPNSSFDDLGDVDLYGRISMYAHGAAKVSKNFDLVLAVNQQVQYPHAETVISGSTRIHLSNKPGHKLALEPGFAARLGDALIPTFYVMYNQWQFGLSYDANVSAFTNASTNNGGPEFTVVYVVKKPEPVESKICPPYL